MSFDQGGVEVLNFLKSELHKRERIRRKTYMDREVLHAPVAQLGHHLEP